MYTLVVTGASGVGKTAAVHALSGRRLPGVRCFHFDTIGVPSPDVMDREYRGQWQEWATRSWLERLDRLPGDVRVAVLDGQTRPSFVMASLPTLARRRVRMALLDCAPDVREARLRDGRQQPELANAEMTNWAAYLRNQAAALGIPVVDTSRIAVDVVADHLEAIIAPLLKQLDRPPNVRGS